MSSALRVCCLAFPLLALLPLPASAEAPRFEVQTIHAEAEYPACAVFDVNRDGQLDIVSGGFWYEAPRWTKHFLREVEVIRGRFDDYSNLEYDVNADGWADLISVNYRSKSLFWVEHPGEKIKSDPETPWTKHAIDTPGPMETGRLYDIDGDGRLDILPNGADFAAWYEIVHSRDQRSRPPEFVKHDLPQEIAGHGIGFGDVNGDGRGDIVGPRGWLEAPEDRRGGRWLWHPDWELHRDASIPILVYDVDGDGDNDLVYGRGHRHGLYWLENHNPKRKRGTEDSNPTRERGAEEPSPTRQRENDDPRLRFGLLSEDDRWTRHAIDTSWAQAHTLLLADLDGDQRPELIAGKRYMGHEGKDPGEYDDLCAFAYSFDKQTRAWNRSEIYLGKRIGFGLDPKAADIDGDGDLDLVAADRCGLSLLENTGELLIFNAERWHQLDRWPGYNHQKVDVVHRADGDHPIQSPADWALRRRDIVLGMQEAMGLLPDPSRRVPLDVQIESRDETPDYARIKLTYGAEPGDRVPALLLVPTKALTSGQGAQPPDDPSPRTATSGRGYAKKLPAMLCLHPTNVDGKAQTAALVGPVTRHYGHQLAQLGFVCLIPDYPSFGDYKDYDFQQKKPGTDEPLYESGTMKAIWNNIRAVDLLESLDYVDVENIGAIGHSLGGHNALYTAVFEPRLKCVVTSCGFNAFHHYYAGNLKGWTSDRYMPRIRNAYESNPDKMPFDFPEVLAAIAPRPVYVAAPLHDANFEVEGVRKCVAAAQPVYELLGGKENLVAEHPDCAHDFPDDVRARVYAWLQKQLK